MARASFSIYIYIEECLSVSLSVRYAFPHHTTDFDETFQEWPLHPEEGRRLLFSEKKTNPTDATGNL